MEQFKVNETELEKMVAEIREQVDEYFHDSVCEEFLGKMEEPDDIMEASETLDYAFRLELAANLLNISSQALADQLGLKKVEAK